MGENFIRRKEGIEGKVRENELYWSFGSSSEFKTNSEKNGEVSFFFL